MLNNRYIKKTNFSFLTILQILLFVTIFSFPRILQTEKILLLSIIIVIGLLRNKYQRFNSGNVVFYSVIVIISFFFGILNNNDVVEMLNSLRIYYVFPLLLLLLLLFYTNEELEYSLKRSSYYSIIIIIVFAFSSLLNALGIFPVNLNSLFYKDEINVGMHDGFFHVINTPLSSLIFLLPLYYNNLTNRLSFKNHEIYVLIFAFIICLISSRRILLLPFIFIYLLNIKRLKYVSILIVLFLFYFVYRGFISQIFIDTFIERLSDAINETGDSEVRNVQKQMFINYIENQPFYGYGLGGYMSDYLRNDEFKSAYETSFYYLFFVLGIPLGIVFFIYYFRIFKDTLVNKSFTNSYRKGVFYGSLCLLVASYTNPYWMSSFDFILPFALILRSAKV